MRKVVLSVYLSLDGVMEEPKWSFAFWSEEAATYARDQLFASDALLLGRVTYEGFAAAWPSVTDAEGFADRMNSLPKFVASRTLQETTWNATLIQGDVAEAVARLKQQPGQDILIYGSAELAHTLRQYDLIDEYRLWIHPVVLGKGKRLFQESEDTTPLQLVATQTFRSGVVILSYQPVKKEAA